jgi:hypothetical protein
VDQPSILTMGYGAGGGDPIEWGIPCNKHTDTSYLKLFVSTRYVDMNIVEQVAVRHGARPRRGEEYLWDTLMFAVTCRPD